MATSLLSTKGQVVIPHAIRQRHHWRPGQKLAIEEIADGVVLRAQPVRPDLRRLVGIVGYRGPAKSLAEMATAIAQGAGRHDCN